MAELTVRVAVPDPPTMLGGLIAQVRPNEQPEVRVTVPVNPLTGATVMVIVAVSPALTFTAVALRAIVKSVTLNGSHGLTAALLFASPL